MPIISKEKILVGNWLQDSEMKQRVFYVTIDDVPDWDDLIDTETLEGQPSEVSASVKNSVSYTFKY